MDEVISFSREKNNNIVIPIINFTKKPVKVKLNTKYYKGTYKNWFTNKMITLNGEDTMDLAPWEYVVLVGNK
jgi:hypothetical protein